MKYYFRNLDKYFSYIVIILIIATILFKDKIGVLLLIGSKGSVFYAIFLAFISFVLSFILYGNFLFFTRKMQNRKMMIIPIIFLITAIAIIGNRISYSSRERENLHSLDSVVINQKVINYYPVTTNLLNWMLNWDNYDEKTVYKYEGVFKSNFRNTLYIGGFDFDYQKDNINIEVNKPLIVYFMLENIPNESVVVDRKTRLPVYNYSNDDIGKRYDVVYMGGGVRKNIIYLEELKN
jgi:hypothetical protein